VLCVGEIDTHVCTGSYYWCCSGDAARAWSDTSIDDINSMKETMKSLLQQDSGLISNQFEQ